MNVFDLFAKISLDTSAYESALNGAKGKASGFGSTLTNVVGHAVDFVKTSLETAGRATAAFIGESIQTGREFDQAMSQVAATMGTSVGEIENLRDFAREMGASTAFSATEAAEALNYMALAGYDAETSMSMLPNVLHLAAAGNFDLARASDMVTDTQTAFGISLERTTQMVDEMAKAASTGNTNVEQLGDAFLTVGGLAQELNGGFVTLSDGTQAEVDGLQELEIALTSMANAGIKGSEAGTHMRNMLLKLASPTAEGATRFEALGVRIFDAGGKMRSLKEIFGDLNTALGRLTQQEKLQAISDLFNTRDTAASEALLHAIGEDWDHIGESILDAKGAAEQMAETQLDNLEGDITKFKSALDEAKISISDRLAPTLRDFVQTGTGELGHLAEAFQRNGFRGLFTVIRLDLEQAKRHISGFVRGIDFAGMAREAGEKAPQVITSMLEAWTDPEWKTPIFETAFDIINNFVDGLFSEESTTRILESAPKIITNLANGITDFLFGKDKTEPGGLFGAVLNIAEHIRDYLEDPKSRAEFASAAEDTLITLGQFLVENVDLLLEYTVKIGQALAEGIITAMLDELLPLFNSEHGWMQEYLNDDTNLSFPEWVAQRHEQERRANTTSRSYLDSENTIRGGAGGQAAADAFRRAMDRGYATGFDAQRPAWLSNVQVGEAGEEVLLPLDSNTAWMDKLAERLGGRMQTGGITIGEINVTVTGTEQTGRAVVEQIDTELRQYQIMQQRGVGGTGW